METKKAIYGKLFELKSEIGKISKDSTNPFFKSKYFDINALLEHVEPLANKHGLLILQPIIDGKVTTQIIEPVSGDMVTSGISLGNGIDPQKKGSEITYYRRYTLSSLLGLQAEDDDGNKATKASKEPNVWLNLDSPQWEALVKSVAAGGKFTLSQIKSKYKISKETEAELKKLGIS